MFVSGAHQPELLKVQEHSETDNNGDIVTLDTAQAVKTTQACTLQPTFVGTQIQRYVHKVMRTSSIQPVVSCGRVNIMHKTHKTIQKRSTNGWSQHCISQQMLSI